MSDILYFTSASLQVLLASLPRHPYILVLSVTMARTVKGASTASSSLGESADSIDTPSDDSDPDESSIVEPSYATRPVQGQSAAYAYLKSAQSNDARAGLSLDDSSIMASIETSADLDTFSGLLRFDEASSGTDSGRQAVVSLRCLAGHDFNSQRLILL